MVCIWTFKFKVFSVMFSSLKYTMRLMVVTLQFCRLFHHCYFFIKIKWTEYVVTTWKSSKQTTTIRALEIWYNKFCMKYFSFTVSMSFDFVTLTILVYCISFAHLLTYWNLIKFLAGLTSQPLLHVLCFSQYAHISSLNTVYFFMFLAQFDLYDFMLYSTF